jgi:hypothetical protein
LKETAVDENSPGAGFEKKPRAGNRSRRAEKLELRHRASLVRSHMESKLTEPMQNVYFRLGLFRRLQWPSTSEIK